jgi:branched-chain amino acid aminotransferase
MKGIEIIENVQDRTEVIYTPCEFWDYEYGLAHKLTTIQEFTNALNELKDGVNERSPFFVELGLVKSQITYEYARYLETCGIVISAFTEQYKYGSFALDYLQKDSISENVLLRFCRLVDTFKIITQKPKLLNKEALAKNGFNNINALNQIVSTWQKKGDSYVWSAPTIVPDGMHVAGPFTVTEQYGQSCFEGMVSMAGKEDTMIVLRPKDNAKRLQISANSIGIPEISEDIFEKSIEYILKANLPFMPENDDFRIYIRPYLKGLEGGYGVGPADTFVFCVQIFPYGSFVGLKDSALDIIAFEEYRRSHEGGFGSKKVSGNYAQTIVAREEVKKGIEGKTYNDVFFLGMKHTKTEINGKSVVVTENVLDEDAAGNLMFFKIVNDQIQLVTPPLKRKAFLGGFTRDTILQLAESLGYKTFQEELKFEELANYDGAFLTGSAVGMAKIKTMTYQSNCIEFYKDTKATEFFEYLYDRFYELRKGENTSEALQHLTTFYKINE